MHLPNSQARCIVEGERKAPEKTIDLETVSNMVQWRPWLKAARPVYNIKYPHGSLTRQANMLMKKRKTGDWVNLHFDLQIYTGNLQLPLSMRCCKIVIQSSPTR